MSEREPQYRAQGVEFIAVNAFEDRDVAREWIAGSGLDLHWAFADESVTEAFGVGTVPTQILIDREGRIAWHSSVTSVIGGADAVCAALDEHL